MPGNGTRFNFWGYDLPVHGQLIDNGHSLSMYFDIDYMKQTFSEVFQDSPEEKTKHKINGGPFPEGAMYRLVQTHWHWGPNNSVGSEHTVDGRKYPLEVHMVHYNEKYPDLETASLYPDGVAVNAFLYQVSWINQRYIRTFPPAVRK